MGLSDEGEDAVEQRFDDLCLALNMDRHAKEEAWESYQKQRTNYSLEGDQIQWLACALYVACRRTVLPTVDGGVTEGNGVSLTRLLRSASFSLIQFFDKMKKWADMANLPKDFRDKVDRLERNFAVSTVIFKKFEPIFLDIFRSPSDDPPRVQRSRKQRRLPCTVTDVFNFCWTMFVQVKGNFPAISDDLVNSYHLLLCCVDWIFANAILGGRRDLLNPEFSGLPDNFVSGTWRPPSEAPCIINILCEKHEGLVLEAKGIKEHWWKPHIKKLFDRKIIRGKGETLSSVLEIGNFEFNVKAVNNAYEEYVLNVGDFDERIFLGDEAEEEIGTPAKMGSPGELAVKMQEKRSLQQHVSQTKTLAPSTPLTGRRYLKGKDQSTTPVSTATQSVSRLQALLSGRKTCPSDLLEEMFLECSSNPKASIKDRMSEMGAIFCKRYSQPSDDHPGSHEDFAQRRLQLAESLYYKVLENILVSEKKRLQGKDPKAVLTGLLEQDIFHRSLFASCLEIVIFSYNSQRIFPWIVDIFDMAPYHFYKVIEVLIRAEEGLSRDVVKHLNHIEECILESLAWRSDSPLWDAIKAQQGNLPTCEEVTLPNQMESGGGLPTITGSPPVHPAVKRLVVGEARFGSAKPKDPLTSPTGPSAADRFSSPTPGSAKRRLFDSTTAGETRTTTTIPAAAVSLLRDKVPHTSEAGQKSPLTATGIIAFQRAQTEDGQQVLIKLPIANTCTLVSTTQLSSKNSTPSKAVPNKPKRTGSLALFFRKVYHLASVRLRELCDKLEVTDDLRRKMWTCFEQSMVQNVELMMDRHIDQLIMCAVYVMARVDNQPQSFQDIMRCYRLQPQAGSHVYRSVLLSTRRRRTSGSSDNSSKNGASGSSSPVNLAEEIKDKDKKRAESLHIRSSSTLPVPHPNSQPPTPTRFSGTGSSFEYEERGDLITFYNQVYVEKMRMFCVKFSSQNKKGDCPPLSPLPMPRSQPSSPRRVSTNHSVYICPHKTGSAPTTPSKGMSYQFSRSPAKDLRAINNMIKMGERRITVKRSLQVDQEEEILTSPAKRAYPGSLERRLQSISNERREANGNV
ncbi:retinoblastoma-like protein 1 [Liolophura sinensis]|uniref:retinoblastoma-like protein 1 n=1 Tax=Liolophura sinensis TaxID=3198878 RepID=UPI0031599274